MATNPTVQAGAAALSLLPDSLTSPSCSVIVPLKHIWHIHLVIAYCLLLPHFALPNYPSLSLSLSLLIRRFAVTCGELVRCSSSLRGSIHSDSIQQVHTGGKCCPHNESAATRLQCWPTWGVNEITPWIAVAPTKKTKKRNKIEIDFLLGYPLSRAQARLHHRSRAESECSQLGVTSAESFCQRNF